MNDKRPYVYFIDICTDKKFVNGPFMHTKKRRFANVYVGISLEQAIAIGVEYLSDENYNSYEFAIKIYDPTTEMFNIDSMYKDGTNEKFKNEFKMDMPLDEKYKTLLHYSHFFELRYTDTGEFIAAYFESPNYEHPICDEMLGGCAKFKEGDLVKFHDPMTGETYPEVYEVLGSPLPITEFRHPLFSESGYELRLYGYGDDYPDDVQVYYNQADGVMPYNLVSANK